MRHRRQSQLKKYLFTPGSLMVTAMAVIFFYWPGTPDAVPLARQATGQHIHPIYQDNRHQLWDNGDFYPPYRRDADGVMLQDKRMTPNKTASLEFEKNRHSPVISIYNFSSRKWVIYDKLNLFWTNKLPDVNLLEIDENKRQVVKGALQIYWTLDETNIADNVRMIVVKENFGEKLPELPLFIDGTHLINRKDRIRMIRNTLQEAFDYWSSALCYHLVFKYIPYDIRVRNSPHFSEIIMVAMRDIVHIDEHSNAIDSFVDEHSLAHARVNFVHFNRETVQFYIAPHLTAKSIYIVQEKGDGTARLFSILSERLANRYGTASYSALYQQHKESIYRLAGAPGFVEDGVPGYTCLSCIALHEIGHVLGIGHVHNAKSVMNAWLMNNEAVLNDNDKRIAKKMYHHFLMRVRKWRICY